MESMDIHGFHGCPYEFHRYPWIPWNANCNINGKDTIKTTAEVPIIIYITDSEIVMVDLGFGDDFFEQNRSWENFGTTISGI